jgi:hypoxanthine phosphoribosyltransferase
MADQSRTSVTKLFDQNEIAQQVERLAGEIAGAMGMDLVVVGILKGSFVFLADLIRALDRIGCAPRVEFVRLRSYGLGRETSGDVRLIGELPEVAGRAVVLVDDVADTGLSLVYGKPLLEKAGAAEVRTCALVDKPSRRKVPLQLDFVGFTVGDHFVVGYGIDYAERYRHLPYIGAIH